MFHLIEASVQLALLVGFGVTAFAYVQRAQVLHRGGPWPQPETLGWVGATAAFLFEAVSLAVSTWLSLFWWPFAKRRQRSSSKGVVVLVHDWGMTRGSLVVLMQRLWRAGWDPICLSGQPMLRDGLVPAAEALRRWIDANVGSSQITLIGHGAGGVVARYYCQKLDAERVRRLVTLGSPYRGTETAQTFYCRELLPGGNVQRQLYPDVLAQTLDVIAVHSSFDAVVLPPVNALYPNAFNVQLDDVGHFTLLYSPKVFRLLVENLEAPLPAPGEAKFSAA